MNTYYVTAAHCRMSRRCLTALVAASLAIAAAAATFTAAAQTAPAYPAKPIRLVVPSAAGGNGDIMARITAEGMSRGLGQPILVDNQASGRTIVGTSLVAKAAPDGYTLIMASSSHAVIPGLFPKLPYDPLKDFAPVGRVAATSLLLVAHPSVPANSVKELIALAKASPGTLNYASSGIGSPANMGTELLNVMAGIKLVHVSYKATAQGNTDTIAGVVQLGFSGLGSLLPTVKSGKLKALAVSSRQRLPLYPDIPTVAETLPGYESVLWNCILAPASTPRPIIARLNGEIIKAVNTPDVRAKLVASGNDPDPSTPEELGAYVEAELKKWARVIKEAGIKAEEE